MGGGRRQASQRHGALQGKTNLTGSPHPALVEGDNSGRHKSSGHSVDLDVSLRASPHSSHLNPFHQLRCQAYSLALTTLVTTHCNCGLQPRLMLATWTHAPTWSNKAQGSWSQEWTFITVDNSPQLLQVPGSVLCSEWHSWQMLLLSSARAQRQGRSQIPIQDQIFFPPGSHISKEENYINSFPESFQSL